MGSGRGTEESPEVPLISVNSLNVPHCPAGGDLLAISSVILKGLNLLQA